jgi:hypothetical protein
VLPSRTYRHVPWLVGLSIITVGAVAALVRIVVGTAAQPSLESVLKALLGVLLLTVVIAFAVLNWRVRTVVDAGGVTQYWMTRSFHVLWTEITALEVEHVYSRWFIRATCGDSTYEIITCPTYLPSYLSDAIGRPRALRAALADIEHRLAAVAPPVNGRSWSDE